MNLGRLAGPIIDSKQRNNFRLDSLDPSSESLGAEKRIFFKSAT
jgi:hypothetical protein